MTGSSSPVSVEVHREYHQGPKALPAKYGTHQDTKFWRSTGFEPGEQMFVGMAPKRAEWLRRVLARLER